MLGASPLSVTYSSAEIGDNQGEKMRENERKTENSKKERLGAILTEKIVNGKLEIRQYALPEDISEEDLQRMLSLEGQISAGHM